MLRTEDREEYIRQRVRIDDNGCWNWLLATSSTGYGFCGRRDVRGLAHRFSYTVARGPIPDGMQLDHLCRNRRCVNPDHLEVVDGRENIRRANFATFGRNYSLFQRRDGLWTAVYSTGGGASRSRKAFRSKTRSGAVSKIESWLSTQ